MCEILFRSKCLDNGKLLDDTEWVMGAPWHSVNGNGRVYMRCTIEIDGRPVIVDAAVDPATIGQYIRLNDKNGKKAFTGDITMDTQGRKWVIFDCPGGFGTCNPWQWENHLSGDPTFLYSSLSDRQSADWFTRHNTIIGNIHDNPELLEEAEK